MDIGKRITELRKAKKLSTNKLANMSGVSQSYLREVEIDNKNVSVQFLELLCEQLEISLSDFFSNESNTRQILTNDPLIKKIYNMNPEQRKALSHFIDTIQNPPFS